MEQASSTTTLDVQSDLANAGRFVHYGCGAMAPYTWTNFDSSPTLRIQKIPVAGPLITRHRFQFPPNVRYGDIVKGLPVRPESCDAIYCSHVLQHLTRAECRRALCNTFNYLKRGGRFRVVVPDLKQLAKGYLNTTGPDAAHKFLSATRLGRAELPRNWLARFLYGMGRTGKHLWMWDHASMMEELKSVGFETVRKAELGDSSEQRFADVEDPDRWFGAVGIECTRPQGPRSVGKHEKTSF